MAMSAFRRASGTAAGRSAGSTHADAADEPAVVMTSARTAPTATAERWVTLLIAVVVTAGVWWVRLAAVVTVPPLERAHWPALEPSQPRAERTQSERSKG